MKKDAAPQIDSSIEVAANQNKSMIEGFGAFQSIAEKYLAKYKIKHPKDATGDVEWYPLEKWIAAYRDVAGEIGHQVFFQIGMKVPENAVFPPSVHDVPSAMASIGFAFHMNHRKGGEVMFDPTTGKMLEGIGHYKWQANLDKKEGTMICDNDYPCDFDRGIITCLAMKFDPGARVVHMPGDCRRLGGKACTYIVGWR